MTKKPCGRVDAQPRATALLAGAFLAALSLWGCSAPAVEGYQVQAPPDGFLYAAAQDPSGGVLSRRDAVSQGVWYGDIFSDEPRSTLEVTRYRGPATEEEAAAARDARAARVESVGASDYNRIGPLRARTLPDSGAAWSWTEERHDGNGRLRSMQVSEVLSWDTVSFSLVFDTSVPERMSQDSLDAVLASFALGRTVVHWGVIWGVGGTLAVLVGLLALRARRTPDRSYRLWDKQEIPKSPGPPSPGASGHGEQGSPS